MINIMQQTTLAIIIPCYNTSVYVKELIDDLMRQTFIDFVAFLINDGSEDDTIDVLLKVSQADARFLVINRSNGGPGAARNTALDYIEQTNRLFRYIWFCDSDDRIETQALDRVIKAMDKHRSDYGLMSVRHFDKVSEITYPAHIHTETILNHEDIVCQYFRFGGKWRKEPSSEAFLNNKVFRYSIIRDIRFREDIFRAEDLDFFFRLLPKLKRGVLVPDVFYLYRKRKSSLTCSFDMKADLIVCEDNYSSLIHRTKVEQVAMQHRLIRSYYLVACNSYNNKNINEFNDVLRRFKMRSFIYPIMWGDMKVLVLLGPLRRLLTGWIRLRNWIKLPRSSDNFFE